jgi:hypothetical protein
MFKDSWLSHLEERAIKAQFNQLIKHTSHIDSTIIPILKRLNTIDGLVTLYSCQGHKASNNPSYLAIRCTEEMIYFLTEAIDTVTDTHSDVDVLWDEFVLYNVLGKQKSLSCVIIKSEVSYKFMDCLANQLDV